MAKLHMYEDHAKYYRYFLTCGSCQVCGNIVLLVHLHNGDPRVCDYNEISYSDLPNGSVLVEPGGFEYSDNPDSVDCAWAPADSALKGFVRHLETCGKDDKGK